MRHPHGLRAASGAGDAGWDISAAQYDGTPVNFFSVVIQDLTSRDLFFKPDGTKLYVIGSTGDNIYEYNLSTAWDIGTASFLQLKSVAAEEDTPNGLFFKPDGTKLYVIGSTGDDINEYDLSIPWDISTASYMQLKSISLQESNPQGLFFKPDGTKLYVIGTGGIEVNEYDLSIPWDISTATFLQFKSVSAQELAPQGLFFKPDGTKLYVIGTSGIEVNEYNLSTPWNISTATFLQFKSVLAQDVLPTGLFLKPDGTKLYVLGAARDAVREYDLSTAWNISTASYISPTNNYFSVETQETLPQGLFFKPDGTKLYVIGSIGDDINEYDLSTPWNINTASFLRLFSVSSQTGSPSDLFFKPDGTKLYVMGSTPNNSVLEYNLSTAWNISTASYMQLKSISLEESNPQGLFFKPDGTKLYITGTSGDDINEYNLSTPWDISTLSFLQLFSVAAQETLPGGLFFKPDGTKVYVIGQTGRAVYEYNLSTPWNISTASFLQSFSVAAQEANATGLFFKSDGTKLYVIGTNESAIWSYDL
jgi:DNA-binding beta-propeller fold protein YncE